MYLVVVTCKNGPQITLMFNNSHRAAATYRTLKAADRDEDTFEIEVEDDYGQAVMVNRDETALILMQSVARVHDGQTEIAMMQQRAQAAMQRKAMNDPGLKLLTPAGAPNGMRLG